MSIARLNCAAVEAVLEPGTFDHADEAEQHFAADAVAFAVAQTGHFLRALQLLAIDYECIAANGSALAERG